jgi:hypothetical protein
LIEQCHRQLGQALDQAAQVPPLVTYRFEETAAELPVLKTRFRRVISLERAPFRAQVVVRQSAPARPGADSSARTALDRLVPKGGRYAFDLIA